MDSFTLCEILIKRSYSNEIIRDVNMLNFKIPLTCNSLCCVPSIFISTAGVSIYVKIKLLSHIL